MNRSRYSMAVLLLMFSLLLASCNKPKTPQEVSTAFWNAVVEGKVKDVVRYSTLNSEVDYDAFARDWAGMIPSWGRVIIEETEARIHTHISKPDASESEMLYFVTYLTKQDDGWMVDYEKTAKAVRASAAVSDFVNRITAIGNEISQTIEETSKEISKQLGHAETAISEEMEAMNQQLMQLAEALGTRASIVIEDYSQRLRDDMNSLVESIEKAIREQQEKITPEDRETMENAIDDLNESSKKLAEPDMSRIAETGEVVVITRKNLGAVNAETFSQYQEQWQQDVDQFLEDMNKLLEDLAAKINQI